MKVEFYCNKCGYLGPESDHKRPGDGGVCYYLAAPVNVVIATPVVADSRDGVIAIDESKALEKRRLKLAKRRERIARTVMPGLVIKGGYSAGGYYESVARDAVKMADALIAELDK